MQSLIMYRFIDNRPFETFEPVFVACEDTAAVFNAYVSLWVKKST